MNNIIPVITIDGLASSGKSTVTKKLSEELGFYILDSGILYRTFAYLKNIGEIELFDNNNISNLIKEVFLEPTDNLSFNVLFKGINITKYLINITKKIIYILFIRNNTVMIMIQI